MEETQRAFVDTIFRYDLCGPDEWLAVGNFVYEIGLVGGLLSFHVLTCYNWLPMKQSPKKN